MTGDKFTYMKVVILLHFISNLVLVRGDGEMDICRLQGLSSISEIAESETVEGGGCFRVSDCSEWRRLGRTTSGIYWIFPKSMWRPLAVYCDMETDGGGWTVFQRRMDGSVDFYRNWMNYTFGFGDLSGEFWLGNEFVNILTLSAPCELRIDMEDFDSDTRVAKYGLFSIGQRSEGYVLSVEHFTGNVTDSLRPEHNNRRFSTYDFGPSSSCSKSYKGGWWYSSCHYANLNGLYHPDGKHSSPADGVNWYHWRGYYYSLKRTEMKFRPNQNGNTLGMSNLHPT